MLTSCNSVGIGFMLQLPHEKSPWPRYMPLAPPTQRRVPAAYCWLPDVAMYGDLLNFESHHGILQISSGRFFRCSSNVWHSTLGAVSQLENYHGTQYQWVRRYAITLHSLDIAATEPLWAASWAILAGATVVRLLLCCPSPSHDRALHCGSKLVPC